MEAIFEVYENSDTNVASLPDAIFQTMGDAEAFATAKALIDGKSYLVCQRKLSPEGTGKAFRDSLNSGIVLVNGSFNIDEQEVDIHDTYFLSSNDTKLEDDFEINEKKDISNEYDFSGQYRIKPEYKTFDDIKENIKNMLMEKVSNK